MNLSDDAFLGGALQILQSRTGYRAGLDAVLLAAAAPVQRGAGERVLDAGAGVGVVGLSVARRIEDAAVTLVEMEPQMAALARQNIERNGLAERVRIVVSDVGRGGAAFGEDSNDLAPGRFHHVLANPPYLIAGRGTEPHSPLKAAAHAMPAGLLDAWVRFLTTAACADGTVTIIHRAEALGQLLTALDGRFGALRIFPLFPRTSTPATRVIVQGIKSSRAPLRLLPGLVLHDEGNAFRPEVEAVLRHGAPLDLGG